MTSPMSFKTRTLEFGAPEPEVAFSREEYRRRLEEQTGQRGWTSGLLQAARVRRGVALQLGEMVAEVGVGTMAESACEARDGLPAPDAEPR